jgi:hypothetical protein
MAVVEARRRSSKSDYSGAMMGLASLASATARPPDRRGHLAGPAQLPPRPWLGLLRIRSLTSATNEVDPSVNPLSAVS